jgi:pimeloyl-ACP methyl ester carboxylesterase
VRSSCAIVQKKKRRCCARNDLKFRQFKPAGSEMPDEYFKSISFPVGYYKFHKKQLFNFQLNRWHSLGYARYDDMVEAGKRIRNFRDWKTRFLNLAETSEKEIRLLNAAFYYRAAEFYTKSSDPDKDIYYHKFLDLFYTATADAGLERFSVPYMNGFLSVLRIKSVVSKKGLIVLHGGFDSFIEEWFSMMVYLSGNGYDVIGFEGPGQGAALRKYGLPLTYEWEKPVHAVLDYFNIDDITLLGLSMGGWFALRAAAFEPRVKRVIASGHAIDYMKCMNPFFRAVHLWCMKHCGDFMNRMAKIKFENREGMASWVVDHLKFITQKKEPLDALEIYMQMNDRNIHPERVTQDVLILSGQMDHFIPVKMHDMQIKALIGARSVTGRIFTAREQAQNHCQTGNIRLALDEIIRWIGLKS